MLEAILFAHEEIKKIVSFIEEIISKVGKEKMEVTLFKPDEEIEKAVRAFATEDMKQAVQTIEKARRMEKMDLVKTKTLEKFEDLLDEYQTDIEDTLQVIIKEEVRKLIVHDNIRPDNRKLDEIRPICDNGFVPRAHGSGLFTRGQTQVMSIATLGALGDVQILDGLDEEESKKIYASL